jgi:hypothetical protein
MLWLLWISLMLPTGLFVLAVIAYGGNRSFLLIGRTSDGHHQIELACDACHTSVFGGPEVLQSSCVKCHGADLKAANDAHPQSKFTDPRNADRTAVLDARYCVTCHREHRPGITRAMGVTLPDDYCVLCHNDIAEDRPSHKGLAFTTCASAGCHNFHDNRALYQDFLVKNSGQPDQLDVQRIALADWLARKEDAIKFGTPLDAKDADAPEDRLKDAPVLATWAGDVHARAGVNCGGCHTGEEKPESWIAAPGLDACRGCHADQARTVTEGRHGMRLREGLLATREGPFALFSASPLPPMTPATARLAMKPDARHTALGCNSCHAAHDYTTTRAKAEACAGCHDDTHTKAYFASPHYDLLRKEAAGLLPRGSGVSCATCHMPVTETRREDGAKTIFATHNQNDNLRPNEKMARSVCGHCHGLQFTLDALADPALVRGNFTGRPAVRVESIEWARRRAKERNQARK